MSLVQTPSKYVLSERHILAKKGCKSVPIPGSADKRSITYSITAIFIITLNGEFFHQYNSCTRGETMQSLPRFKFPDLFLLSVNLLNDKPTKADELFECV